MKKARFLTVLSAGLLIGVLAACDSNGAVEKSKASRFDASLTFDAGYYTNSLTGETIEGYWRKFDKNTGEWIDVPGRRQTFTVKKVFYYLVFGAIYLQLMVLSINLLLKVVDMNIKKVMKKHYGNIAMNQESNF